MDEHPERMFTPQKFNPHHLAVDTRRRALAGVEIDAHDGFGSNPIANLQIIGKISCWGISKGVAKLGKACGSMNFHDHKKSFCSGRSLLLIFRYPLQFSFHPPYIRFIP
jgi:hypothetical protein